MACEPFVVHRDAHLLVVFKPSGMATTAPEDGDCLVRWARDVDTEAQALHPVSRLDAEVSGLVTFARTRLGNQALLAARASGAYRRFYLALAACARSFTASLPRSCAQHSTSAEPRHMTG